MAPGPGDVERVRAAGFTAYVDEQLRPSDRDDLLCQHKLESVRLHIEYEAGKTDGDPGKSYPACKEDRPLRYLNASAEDLWKLTDAAAPTLARPIAPAERDRVLAEVRVAHLGSSGLQQMATPRGTGRLLAQPFQRQRWRSTTAG